MPTTGTQTTQAVQDQKKMKEEDYEEILGRLVTRKGVRGVAVTSKNGEIQFYNNGVPQDMIKAYTKVCNDVEYLCTVGARENDPSTRWYYVRVETDDYEMVVSVEDTHLALMLCDAPETYNGELVRDVDDDEDMDYN